MFGGKKSRNFHGNKYNSVDKIDRIVNFEGKVIDSDLILQGDYQVNRSGKMIILSPVHRDTYRENMEYEQALSGTKAKSSNGGIPRERLYSFALNINSPVLPKRVIDQEIVSNSTSQKHSSNLKMASQISLHLEIKNSISQ